MTFINCKPISIESNVNIENGDDYDYDYVKLKDKNIDGGWGWVVVFCSFIGSFLGDGVTYGMGALAPTFIQYFKISRYTFGWIGSIQFALTLLSGVPGDYLCRQFGYRTTTVLAGCLSSLGYMIPFVFHNIYAVFIGPGIITGIGFGLLYQSSISIVNLWFNKYSGIAMSISICGSGLGTFVLSPLIDWLLTQYSWQGCLLILSGIMLNLIPCGLLFLEPQHLTRQKSIISVSMNSLAESSLTKSSNRNCLSYWQLLINSIFIIFALSNFLTNVAFNAPFLYVNDRALQMGVTETWSAILISCIGIGYTIGQLLFGFLATYSRIDALHLYAFSLILCGVALCASWVASTYPLMVVYTTFFGMFSGAYVSLLPVTLKNYLGTENVDRSFALINIFQGVAVLFGPPLIGFIYDTLLSYDIAFFICGSFFVVSGVVMYVIRCLESSFLSSNFTK